MSARRCFCSTLIIGLLACAASGRAQAASPIVAVFDTQFSGVKLSPASKKNLGGYFADKLAASGAFQLVPRADLKKRLARQKRASYRDCYDQSCQIEIGRELAANKSLSSKVTRIGKECVVSATLYDLKRAASERGATARGSCSQSAIMESMEQVIRELAGEAAPSTDATSTNRAIEASIEASIKASIKAMPASIAKKAAAAWASCGRGRMIGCKDLGNIYFTGEEGVKDYAKAFALYTRACDRDLAAACFNLGLMYFKGLGVPLILSKTAALYKKACDGGLDRGCYFLGELHFSGKGGLSRDRAKGLALCQKGCNAGYLEGCNSLGLKYELGLDVPRDYGKAFELFKKACDGGTPRGCLNVGISYMKGRGVPRSNSKAAAFLKSSCDKGIQLGCRKLKLIGGGR